MRYVLLIVLLVFLMTACDTNRVFEDNHKFKERAWRFADSTSFVFTIPEPAQKYTVYYTVRNSLDYPFSRLFVNYTLRDSSGKEISGKLLSEFLFDRKTSKPTGDSGLGDIYDHRIPVLKDFAFNRAGRYSLTLQQFMRRDTLAGILAVGVRVEKATSLR